MALADKWRRIADKHRALPAKFGLREHTAEFVFSQWSSGIPGEGDEVTTVVPITVYGGHPPKISFPTQREIILGLMSLGTVTVGPFTPNYGSGGIDRSSFDGTRLQTGDGMRLRLTGPQHPNGCLYRVKNSNVDHALRVTLVCIPVEGG